jgi:FtsH-binding integral membrane protein
VLVLAARRAEAEALAVRPEIDAWARIYLAQAMNARQVALVAHQTRNQRHRSGTGSTAVLVPSALAILLVVGTQTWSLLTHSLELFVLATAAWDVACLVMTRRRRRTNGALLLTILGWYGVVGSVLGSVVALTLGALSQSSPGIAAAWWIWGALQLLALVVCARTTSARPARRVRG